ncbi:PAS domain S-box-containing protein [Tenacibaculum sp. MAR_2009_124]|uniref:PAS domain-containing protein n=1 Tax=Tenacibaculum sp. MAR_2009_124 TaxID=1250059 RepID=UPI000896054D|nr:PAS domain-containing protein [Tenacibaculum sp. MAR_2009_124]SEC54416.1 PAS domain S-box-containing protein [Tenacibaculum sp. MAR_2009_124]
MNTNLAPRPKKIIDEEVKWDTSSIIISKTDLKGTILYMNDTFEEASEYPKVELVGEPHNIIRHPDMPKVVFKVLWKALKNEENFHAIVKNLSKTGRYYWVITDFEVERDQNGKATGYTGRRKSIPQSVIDKIEPLYKTLLKIEQVKGEKASELYFNAYLEEEIGKPYNEFVLDLFDQQNLNFQKQTTRDTIKKGLTWFFFGD